MFRGTELRVDSPETYRQSLQGWLANLDFAQVAEGDGMVHRGYARELDGVSGLLMEVAGDHAAGGKPLYVTGHSAGGALAMLAARRLHDAGVPVRAAVVFSAPRVGDRRFAASYPLPLLRIEHRHDLIPHLPLPPSLAKLLGHGLVDPLVAALDWLQPALRSFRLAGTEYVHAGQLLYDDGGQALYRVAPGDYWRRFGPLLRQELAADLLGRGPAPDAQAYRATTCPRWATPVPARLMDGVRLPATLTQILRQAQLAPARLPAGSPYRRGAGLRRPDRAGGRLSVTASALLSVRRRVYRRASGGAEMTEGDPRNGQRTPTVPSCS